MTLAPIAGRFVDYYLTSDMTEKQAQGMRERITTSRIFVLSMNYQLYFYIPQV